MTQIHFQKLEIPPAKSTSERIEQLKDEIRSTRVVHRMKGWSEEKQIDLDEWKITYPDGATIGIIATEFVCLVGNQETQVDSLKEAEEWLWDNFSADNYADEDIKCGACTVAIGAHTFDGDCKLDRPKDKPKRFSTNESLEAGMCLHYIPMGEDCPGCEDMA